MAEYQLFPAGTVPVYTQPEWYRGRERAPHLEQPGHGQRLLHTAEYARWLLNQSHPRIKRLVDYGAGDGGLLSVLQPAFPDVHMFGYDLQQTNVDGARERGVSVRLADVLTDNMLWGEVAVCTEMLEHLVDPHAFVCTLFEHVYYVIASSPATETDRGAYEFHTWAWDMSGYAKMFRDAGFEILRHEMCVDSTAQLLMAYRPTDSA